MEDIGPEALPAHSRQAQLEETSERDLAYRWGVKLASVNQARQLGLFIKYVDNNDRGAMRLPASYSIEAAFKDWLDIVLPFRRYEDWKTYCTLRKRLGVHSTLAHEERLLDNAATFLLFLKKFDKLEIRVILQPGRALPAVTEDLRRRAGLPPRRKSPKRKKDTRIEAVRERVIAEVANLSFTCFDPDESELHRAPKPGEWDRLASVKNILDYATMAMIVYTASNSKPSSEVSYGYALEIMDKVISESEVNWQDSDHLVSISARFLKGEFAGPLGAYARADIIKHWKTLRSLVDDHLKRVDEATRSTLQTIMPAHDRKKFKKLNKDATKIRSDIGDVGLEARKERVAEISHEQDLFLQRIDRRRDQLAAVGNACRDAEMLLLKRKLHNLDFAVSGPGLSFDGSLMSALQHINMRAWTERALLLHMHDRLPKEMRRPTRRILSRLSGHGSIFFEHIDTFGEDPIETEDPFYIPILKFGLQCQASVLPPHQRDERRDLKANLRIPTPHNAPKGLLSFEKSRYYMQRYAAWCGMTVIPIIEFDHAMRHAHLLARTTLYTGVRPHEAMQMAENAACWDTEENRLGTFPTFNAVGKVPRHLNLEEVEPLAHAIDPRTYRYYRDLLDLVSLRCHGGEMLPNMAPAPTIAWKVPAQRYVFSHDGKALTYGNLNYLLRFLTAGLIELRPHDPRHCFAQRLSRGEVSDQLIALLLGNTPAYGAYYAAEGERTMSSVIASDLNDRMMAQDLGLPTVPQDRRYPF
jgi:hypothetical protein